MKNNKLVLGVAPVKRKFLSMDAAKEQKDKFMRKISELLPESITIINIDDICENGIAFEFSKVEQIVKKFKDHSIDALFLPFCDFGEETVAAAIASSFKIPTLVWGPRDEYPNTDTSRGRDSQCGIIAATKVLRRFGVKYSYIVSSATESEEFANGFINFIRAASVVKEMKGMRIARFGNRPDAFMSVIANEGSLVERFNIVSVPITVNAIAKLASEIVQQNGDELLKYHEDFTSRVDCSAMTNEMVKKAVAIKIAMQQLMESNNCTAASIECWPAFEEGILDCVPCIAVGELTDLGLPVSCEGDINGAITLAILNACSLGEQTQFFADLTIRHPENDNAELLWHCGPFPYSLKAEDSKARMVNMMGRWELKKGDITIGRFDDVDGEFYLFAAEGRATAGPETTGTYVWLETDNWKKWEEKLVFGPYIHHVGGMYGKYVPALREAARYLGIKFDTVGMDEIHSL